MSLRATRTWVRGRPNRLGRSLSCLRPPIPTPRRSIRRTRSGDRPECVRKRFCRRRKSGSNFFRGHIRVRRGDQALFQPLGRLEPSDIAGFDQSAELSGSGSEKVQAFQKARRKGDIDYMYGPLLDNLWPMASQEGLTRGKIESLLLENQKTVEKNYSLDVSSHRPIPNSKRKRGRPPDQPVLTLKATAMKDLKLGI